MNEIPTQEQIDSVAHFVETVRELRSSPFFQEEYRSFGLSMKENAPRDEIEGRFPDQQIIQGALVPFRRVWHQSEACHHVRIVNILRRYIPEYRSFLDPLLFTDKDSMAGSFEWTRNTGLTPTQAIDIWLNTRYHPIGRGRSGLFSRDDFDRFNRSIGPVIFEFFFLQSFFEFSVSLFNILQCAEGFLRAAEAEGLRPSFEFSANGDPRITRRTPGYTPATDSEPHKVWRLRRRDTYKGISHLFSLLNLPDENIAELLNYCDTFEEFTREAEIRMERVENFEAASDQENFDAVGGCLDNHTTATRNRKCRRGFIGKRRDGTLVWSEDYFDVVRDQYIELRVAFHRQPFR